MHQYTALYQEVQHGNLQDLGGVEEPAPVNLVVRHIDVKNSEEPH